MNPALRIPIAFIACLIWAHSGKSQIKVRLKIVHDTTAEAMRIADSIEAAEDMPRDDAPWAPDYSEPDLAYAKEELGDIFSFANRHKYAGHLESMGDFGGAAREWQALYRISLKDSHLLAAARDWRLDRHPALALVLLDSALENGELIQQKWLFNAERRYNETLLGRYTVDPLELPEDSAYRHLVSLMIAGRIAEAEQHYNTYQTQIDPRQDRGLDLLILEIKTRKRHSKFIAGALGAVLPGSGKLYSGHAVDAFQAFMAVGLNAVMASVAYRDLGSKSFWPWFFGGMGAGFYLGNIVGSVNTVKRDEALFNKQLAEHAYGYYYSRLLAD